MTISTSFVKIYGMKINTNTNTLEERACSSHWIRGCMGLRACLETGEVPPDARNQTQGTLIVWSMAQSLYGVSYSGPNLFHCICDRWIKYVCWQYHRGPFLKVCLHACWLPITFVLSFNPSSCTHITTQEPLRICNEI